MNSRRKSGCLGIIVILREFSKNFVTKQALNSIFKGPV